MRRVITPIAAALLALTIAGPVAADPVSKDQFPNVYVTDCGPDGPKIPDQSPAHATPGWGIDWEPGDTPWLLMGYKFNVLEGGSWVTVFTDPLPPGLEGKLYGPCTITWGKADRSITEAYFLKANQHDMQ